MAPEKSHSPHLSVPSPDGALIATVQPGRLTIRPATSSGAITTFRLPSDSVIRCKHIRWSRSDASIQNIPQAEEEDWLGTKPDPQRRILISDDDNIRVFDVANPTWKGTIRCASSNVGAIANVAFGFSADELLVFSDFGVKLTIWSLVTSRGIEVKDPKYGVACYSHRPKTGHLALLTRSVSQDVMLLLKPSSHEVLKHVELGTVDAQEVLWSKDGKWVVVIDAASVGHKAFIYTADGQLFKIWTGRRGPEVQLGIKSVGWTDDALLIGDYNDDVTLLKKNTFSLLGTFTHLPTIAPSKKGNQKCWEEQIDALKERSYAEALQPVNPPTSDSLAKTNTNTRSRHGISIITLSADASMLATRSDTWPTTIWIWSLTSGSMIAALIHHSPVKHMEWHPTIDDLLLIHCSIPDPVIHIWKRTWDVPKVYSLPFARSSMGRLEATWLQTTTAAAAEGLSSDIDTASVNVNINIILTSPPNNYATAQISATDGTLIPTAPPAPQTSSTATAENPEAAALSLGTGPEDMFDEGHSLDFSPVKIVNGGVDLDAGAGYLLEEDFGMIGESEGVDEGVDDTFFGRRGNVRAGV